MLQIFNDYKETLMQALLTNEAIVHLLDPNGRCEDPKQLMYSQVYPYEYVPETVEYGQTFICCEIDIQESEPMIYTPAIYLWVFTHKSLLRLPEGGVRVDKLVEEIDNTINGSFCFGQGRLSLYSCRRFAPMTDYQGKVLRYNTKDINRFNSDTRNPIPSDRRNIDVYRKPSV